MNNLTLGQLLEKYPFVLGYLEENKLDIKGKEDKTLKNFK